MVSKPDGSGRRLRSIRLVFTALTILSIFGLVLVLLEAADEPFVDQPTVEDPIIAYVWLFSHAAAALSVLGYTGWSFRKQRQLKSRTADRGDSSPLEKPIRTVRIAIAGGEDLDEYEARVQKTVFALVLGLIYGNLPFRLILNAVLPL